MATIVLPDINPSTINELRKRFPKLSELDLPSMEKAGRRADEQLNRMRGKPRSNPIVPWIAGAIGLVALIGALSAYLYWMRRPSWDASRSTLWGSSTPLDDTLGGTDEPLDLSSTRSEVEKGLNKAESTIRSATYPLEEA
jgi:hypothetical protein